MKSEKGIPACDRDERWRGGREGSLRIIETVL